ncbi:MAG TPA: hypothetical protein VHE35_30510 [Kofleriaceae bacterium]|nr:hypothetical protein [Kofleriaceae bacterium]
MKLVASIGASIVIAAVAACGAAQARDQLMDTVLSYNDGVRWERFTAAAAAVPPAERDQFLDDREHLAKDLKITDDEVVRVATHGDRAEIQVKLTWYLDSRGAVHETWVRQRWERQGAAWRVVDETRARGEPMPGLADGDDAEHAAAGDADVSAAAPAPAPAPAAVAVP